MIRIYFKHVMLLLTYGMRLLSSFLLNLVPFKEIVCRFTFLCYWLYTASFAGLLSFVTGCTLLLLQVYFPLLLAVHCFSLVLVGRSFNVFPFSLYCWLYMGEIYKDIGLKD
jgi:hypothetical protein